MAEESKPSGKPSTEWIFPEGGRPEVYSNIYHLHWTLVDVRIRFGQIVPDPKKPPEQAVRQIEEQAAVVMSWTQAKFLRDALSDAVKRYEAVNGEIKPPKLA